MWKLGVAVRRNTYTIRGELERSKDALGRKTFFEYDALGRLEVRIEDEGGLNLKTVFQFDKDGNRTVVIDPRGKTYRFEHTKAGGLHSHQDSCDRPAERLWIAV